MDDTPDDEGYSPPSDFLCTVVADEITFGSDVFGRANLAMLIALTRDEDQANRDWATLLLVHTGQDDTEIRAALRGRLDDPFEDARLEALIGVAQREPDIALPIVLALLEEEWVSDMTLEAAAFVADARLLPELRCMAEFGRAAGKEPDCRLSEAIDACESGVQPEWRWDE